jgi:phosphatidate cytidylyltransferase
MILLSIVHDTGGYIVGSLIGKNKLAPQISPKKTWEGFFGGYLLTFISASLIFMIIKSHTSVLITATISFFVSILATIGDLFESWLKRKAGIKDSGNILPEHGGFLDRFDSILAVTLLFFVFRSYLMNLFKIM